MTTLKKSAIAAALAIPLLAETPFAAMAKNPVASHATSFQKSIQDVAGFFKKHCAQMPVAHLGLFALTADELAKQEDVASEVVAKAKEKAAKAAEQARAFMNDSGDVLSKVNFDETEETKGLMAKMREQAEVCRSANEEIEVLAKEVKAFLKDKGYQKALSEKEFFERVIEVTKHVTELSSEKYPALIIRK